ncbi:MAG: hypothetical protein ACD_12C00658G0003 [uncultured bacterium]|nr:MAG: hypothetical protein ACD_12C00658G0003 [uncultured bacterium]
MEEKINRYIKGHMMTIMIIILISFLLLFLGEFFLYRKIAYLNQIISEGLMQIKENIIIRPSPTIFLNK